MSRPIDTADLPDDVTALRGMIGTLLADLSAERAARQAAEAGLRDQALEAEHLRAQLARLRRMQFGQSSERLREQIAQLELALEELEAEPAEAEAAAAEAGMPGELPTAPRRGRKPLPEHLPRRDVEHRPTECACVRCGGTLRQVGTDVTEVLEYVPGRFEVVRHVRPAYSCRTCEAMCQAPMPSLPIVRGRPGPGLLAHVLVSKYADHLPLYRQSEIYAREGVELERATMAAWVGKATSLMRPLLDALARHVMAVYDVDTRNDDTMWEIWIEGFARAMALRPSSWDSMATADRDTRAALAGMRALIEIADGTSSRAKTEIDELTKMAPDLIPTWVDDLHAWRVAQPHAPPTRSSMPGGSKVGRNEPCPCGSGRKYKKCCGTN